MRENTLLNAMHYYSKILSLYPKSYQKRFRTEIIQTFKDQYKDSSVNDNHSKLRFWVGILQDEMPNIIRERISSWEDSEFKMYNYLTGVAVGIAISILASVANILFGPTFSGTQFWQLVLATYIVLFLIFFLKKRRTVAITKSEVQAALIAIISTLIIMTVFILIGNIIFASFQSNNTITSYQEIKEFIINGHIKALFLSLPIAGMIGTFFSTTRTESRKN